MKYLLIVCALFTLTGCNEAPIDRSKEIAASKEVMKNRKLHAKEIITATNECIKSASSLTHLTASGNDQDEVVIACTESAQKAYGAYSPYFESDLQEWATQ